MISSQQIHITELLQSGNPDGLEMILTNYGGKLFNLSYTYLKSKEEAEEMVQDVLLKLWQNKEKIDPSNSLEGYMFRMTKNLLLNRIRDRARKNPVTVELIMNIADNVPADESLYLDEMNLFLKKAIEGLPKKRQKIFKMSRTEGLSNKQIAQELNISEKTVENQIGRAIKYLRSYMAYVTAT